MWPCGIIVVLAELFLAESKSQIYAIIHEFLCNHTGVLDDLSKLHYNNFQLSTVQCYTVIQPTNVQFSCPSFTPQS